MKKPGLLGWCMVVFLFFLLPLPTSGAHSEPNQTARLVASPEPGWPQWRGPRRDGICDERGLLGAWPEGGPRLRWKATGLGNGYSAPIIVKDRIYLAGDFEKELRVFAMDHQGNRVWTATNGLPWKQPYPGARASAVYADRRVFHLNAHGRVACYEADSGKEVWAVQVRERFGGKVNTWAYSECLLVDGPRLIVTPGGTQALMAALDTATGATVWSTEPLLLGPGKGSLHQRVEEPAGEADAASYAAPILFRMGDRRHLVSCSLRHVFGVDADTGKLLWTRPLRTRYSVIAATPVLVDDSVFVTAPDTQDARLYRLAAAAEGMSVTERWGTRLDTCHGCVVYRNGMLYGSWYRNGKGYACVDAATGAIKYDTKELAKGSILYADERLYCLAEDGEMALLKPEPDGFKFMGRFRLVPERKSDVWTHPVILNKRLYLRYNDTLYCYDIAAQPEAR